MSSPSFDGQSINLQLERLPCTNNNANITAYRKKCERTMVNRSSSKEPNCKLFRPGTELKQTPICRKLLIGRQETQRRRE